MNQFYISFRIDPESTAWYKSNADVEYFLNESGFQAIPFTGCTDRVEDCLSNALKKDEDGLIVVQFPRAEYEGLKLEKFAEYIRNHFSKCKLAAIVHDLDSIRYADFFQTNQLTEVPVLNLFDYLISLNDAMTFLLKEQKVTAKIFTMNLFDYVLKDRPDGISSKPTIAFAGNLQYKKSAFLYHLSEVDFQNIKVHLYGPWLDLEKFRASDNIIYKGAFSPNDLPYQIHDQFGLCWDGDSLDHCSGTICRYMKYGNPHKTSLYLAMGIPVIISKDIGAAAFIEKENAGIIISSLYEIPERLNKMTNAEYKKLRKNCLKLSNQLRNGYHIKHVIQEIETDIQSASDDSKTQH